MTPLNRSKVLLIWLGFALVGPLAASAATVATVVVDLDADPPTITFEGRDFGVQEGRVLQAVGPDPVELAVDDWQDQLVTARLAAAVPGTSYLFAIDPETGGTSLANVAIGVVGAPGPSLTSIAICGADVLPCSCPNGIVLSEVPGQCEVTSDTGSCENFDFPGSDDGCCVCGAPR